MADTPGRRPGRATRGAPAWTRGRRLPWASVAVRRHRPDTPRHEPEAKAQRRPGMPERLSSLVLSPWSLVLGPLSLILGAWSLVPGAWGATWRIGRSNNCAFINLRRSCRMKSGTSSSDGTTSPRTRLGSKTEQRLDQGLRTKDQGPRVESLILWWVLQPSEERPARAWSRRFGPVLDRPRWRAEKRRADLITTSNRDPTRRGPGDEQSGPSWRLATGGVLLVALAATVPTTGDIGLTWDEPAYRYSQLVSAQWWERLGRSPFVVRLERPARSRFVGLLLAVRPQRP